MHQISAPLDFRDHAAAESRRLLEWYGKRAYEEYSLCVPNADSDQDAMRRFGYAVLGRFILGILGLAAGGVFAVLDQMRNEGDAVSGLLIVGLACGGGGILLLLSHPFFLRRFVRRRLGPRYDGLAALALDTSPVFVSIEDAATFHRMKIVPEDLGSLILDASRRRVVIEGVCHRYMIYGRDARHIEQAHGGPSTATSIRYAVGDVELCIAIEYVNIWHEFKRQTIGAGDPLVDKIRQTLWQSEAGPDRIL